MKTNTVIQGFIGGGKTRSVLTLLPEYEDEIGRLRRGAGLSRVGLIAMEPGYQHVIRGHGCAQGLHVHYHPPAGVDWDTIAVYAKMLQVMSVKDVVETADPKKRQYTAFTDLLTKVCKSFTCDACGEDLGDIATWGDDSAVFLDGCTSLNTMVQQAVCGGKPVPSKPEYFTMLGFYLAFLRVVFQDCRCSVVLTAHIDREQDAVEGISTLTMDLIGQRLVKQVIKMPDELVTAYQEDGKYYWSNLPGRTGHILKRRALQPSDQLPPDFRQLWHPEEYT